MSRTTRPARVAIQVAWLTIRVMRRTLGRADRPLLGPILCLSALAAALTVPPQSASAQTLDQLFKVMQEGGTWLALDIVDGQGSYTGARVPTMGFRFEGWFQVADVNRGEWDIRVVDLAGAGTPVVAVTTRAGQQVPVSYDAGPTVQVQVDVTWSEPADTVLWVWVGLPDGGSPGGERDGSPEGMPSEDAGGPEVDAAGVESAALERLATLCAPPRISGA